MLSEGLLSKNDDLVMIEAVDNEKSKKKKDKFSKMANHDLKNISSVANTHADNMAIRTKDSASIM